ncbi:MAG: hypothetical protein WC696_07975 [Candidatus Methylopumilus sp.]|jgi:hypothetical protein
MTPPIILDIEASGFGKNSYPIEIGFVSEQAETWCALIKPEVDWLHWDDSAEQVHQISRATLHQRGKTAAYVAQELNDRLHNAVVYTDGWIHDFIWMARLFDAANITQHFKLEDLRDVLTRQQEVEWEATKSQVLLEMNVNRHRASIDAKLIQLTWLRTRGYESQLLA